MGTNSQAALLLKKQLADLNRKPVDGFSAGLIDDENLFQWEVMILGPPDTFYEGGFFKAHLLFPPEYPQKPPKMKFVHDFWHPNEPLKLSCTLHSAGMLDLPDYDMRHKCVFNQRLLYRTPFDQTVSKEGDVCISILHEPGEDKYGYEKPEERWLPIHTVESILLSVISMIADPNDESPANVDAAKEWREDYNGVFKKNVRRCVRKSQEFL